MVWGGEKSGVQKAVCRVPFKKTSKYRVNESQKITSTGLKLQGLLIVGKKLNIQMNKTGNHGLKQNNFPCRQRTN